MTASRRRRRSKHATARESSQVAPCKCVQIPAASDSQHMGRSALRLRGCGGEAQELGLHLQPGVPRVAPLQLPPEPLQRPAVLLRSGLQPGLLLPDPRAAPLRRAELAGERPQPLLAALQQLPAVRKEATLAVKAVLEALTAPAHGHVHVPQPRQVLLHGDKRLRTSAATPLSKQPPAALLRASLLHLPLRPLLLQGLSLLRGGPKAGVQSGRRALQHPQHVALGACVGRRRLCRELLLASG
mmetsp:Transcript_94460/g.281974  ORF Transcript_94460/g.281974 Transcript_94460/m.281974 type:complete len:242 (+) Transcript_94460:166-891(+)